MFVVMIVLILEESTIQLEAITHAMNNARIVEVVENRVVLAVETVHYQIADIMVFIHHVILQQLLQCH
jgi:hypothetical protein